MSAVVFLVVLALVSLLITRVASLALTVTGMTPQSARFQARSALTGVGYTTTEAEGIVAHPARRRIVMALMLLGNIGLVAAVAGLLGGFLAAGGRQLLVRAALLIVGLGAVYVISRSPQVERWLSAGIRRLLSRFTDLDVRDYATLLQLTGDYAVHELHVQPGDWLADCRLDELRLSDEGVLVLGIRRPNDEYIGAPNKATAVHAGDTVVVYGRADDLDSLDQREAGERGDEDHRQRVADRKRPPPDGKPPHPG